MLFSALLVPLMLMWPFVDLHSIQNKNHQIIKTNCNLSDFSKESIFASTANRQENIALVLKQCYVPSLPDGAFNSWNLITLNITDSNLTNLHENAFNALDNLHQLTINDNSIPQIHAWSEHDLINLRIIDLRRNRITEIDVNALCRYPNLQHLDLSVNQVERLVIGTFKCVAAIKSVNLSNNHIKLLESYTFNGLTELTQLSVENNLIEYINPFAFTSITNLESLRINGNHLKAIDSRLLSTLLKLVYLNVSYNELNGIADDTFQSNAELKLLDVSNNAIVGLRAESLRGLSNLEVLNASSNMINKLEAKAVGNLPLIKELDLSSNLLSHLHDHHFGNATMETIILSNNSIQFIHQNAFTDMNSLHYLDLSNNQLSADEFLNELQTVKNLKLSQNNFTTLNISLLHSIEHVELIGNYWRCSWLIPELAQNRIHRGIKFVLDEGNYESKFNILDEIDCYDDNRRASTTKKGPILRHVIVVHPHGDAGCDDDDNGADVEQKFNAINTYPRTFNKLLRDEFDFKACLIWTAIGVAVVIGLIRLGKYLYGKSEKSNNQLLRGQQADRPRIEIDSYLIRPNANNKSRS